MLWKFVRIEIICTVSFYVAHTRVTDVARKAVYGARRKNHPFSLDKAQNGIKGNISENWTQKWTAGPVHL